MCQLQSPAKWLSLSSRVSGKSNTPQKLANVHISKHEMLKNGTLSSSKRLKLFIEHNDKSFDIQTIIQEHTLVVVDFHILRLEQICSFFEFWLRALEKSNHPFAGDGTLFPLNTVIFRPKKGFGSRKELKYIN